MSGNNGNGNGGPSSRQMWLMAAMIAAAVGGGDLISNRQLDQVNATLIENKVAIVKVESTVSNLSSALDLVNRNDQRLDEIEKWQARTEASVP